MAPVVVAALALIGTGVSVYSQYQAGRKEEKARKEAAEIYEAEAAAKAKRAAYEEELSKKETRRLIGLQKLLYAKAGVDVTSGSPLLVMAETAAEGEKEAEIIRYGGEVGVSQARARARIEEMQGVAARTTGYLGAGATFLSGLSRAGTQYYGYTKGIY